MGHARTVRDVRRGDRPLARLRRLYFGAWDPKGGAVEHGPRLFEQPTIHHRPEVYGGIDERRAAASCCARFSKAGAELLQTR